MYAAAKKYRVSEGRSIMLNVIDELYKVILERKESPVDDSYTCYLFEKGLDKILKKVGEESAEVIISSKNDDKKEIVMEISDLLYHLLVLMASKDIAPEDIEEELEKRRQKICNKKPERKV
jgi:phosphoribosyl-ATP pyrophosphohydrolase